MAHRNGTTIAPSSRPSGRSEIMAALTRSALDLMETEGIDVTIRDISTRANVPHSLVARYFGSKEGLITHAIGTTLPDDQDLAASFGSADDAAGALFDSMFERPERIRILAQLLNSSMPAREIGSDGPLLKGLVKAIDEQHPEADDPRIAAAAVGALCAGWLIFEEYLVEHTGLAGEDIDEVRAKVRQLLPGLL